MKYFKQILDYLKNSTIKEQLIIMSIIASSILLACVAIKLVAPFLIAGGFLLFSFHKDNTVTNQQQVTSPHEKLMGDIYLYEQVARMIFPILKEYNTALGIAPLTVYSIYSEEKFIYLPDISVPVLVYTAEKKSPTTVDVSYVKTAIQKRFNQEDLQLYLIQIDMRDPYYFKFYILPIISEDAYNWAKIDYQKRFNNNRPQKPGDRKDKDF